MRARSPIALDRGSEAIARDPPELGLDLRGLGGGVSQADAEFVCGAMEWVSGGRSRHGRLAFTVNLNRTECEVADIEALGQSSCVQGRKAR